MAVRIITGVPGAGKTYYAVQHLLNTYFRWDEPTDSWKRTDESMVIITNIDGFPYSIPLQDELERVGGLENFFRYDFQASHFADRKVIYLIDEAQHMFPFTCRNTEMFLYFQKHRHLGHDVYLITQDADLLAKGLRALAEYHVDAVRRSYSFTGEFRYRFVDPITKDVWKTKVLKRDRRVFAFYRSMETTETEPLKSVPVRQFGICVAVFLAVGALMAYMLTGGRIFGVQSKKQAAGIVDEQPDEKKSKKGAAAKKSESPAVQAPAAAVPNAYAYDPPAQGLLVGRFAAGRDLLFLVEVDDRILRLTDEQMTRLCSCHVDSLSVGLLFTANLTAALSTPIYAVPKQSAGRAPGETGRAGGPRGM